MSAVRTENLAKRFRRVQALKGLDLDMPEHAMYALVGANGAGKTTAIRSGRKSPINETGQ